jgi:hypothetical protein
MGASDAVAQTRPPEGFLSAVLNPSEIGTDECSEDDETERIREPEKCMRELHGGPADAAEIDRILERPPSARRAAGRHRS